MSFERPLVGETETTMVMISFESAKFVNYRTFMKTNKRKIRERI